MSNNVAGHYQQDRLTDRIRSALTQAGYDAANLRPGDIAGVDEFHLGGRLATEELLDGLQLTSESRVLDVGCGIGGAARTVANRFGCSVTGVDLTADFVRTAQELSAAVGMDDSTTFMNANALGLPFPDDEFDAVWMFHVGMNIEDKAALLMELARVARPDGTVIVYDIMRMTAGHLGYPMPWASSAATSFVAHPDEYRQAMVDAGLDPSEPIDRLGLAQRAIKAATEDPPPVNLSHLMGGDWPTMFANLGAALGQGLLVPTQITARPIP